MEEILILSKTLQDISAHYALPGYIIEILLTNHFSFESGTYTNYVSGHLHVLHVHVHIHVSCA